MPEEIKGVAVLEKSIQTLEFLTAQKEGATLREIASGVSLNKSTVYRILQTYRKYGYVSQEPKSGVYRLGSRFLIFSSFISDFDLSSFILPYMESFSEETGLSTNLTLLEGRGALTVENYIPTTASSIRICASKGFCADLHSSASGKVFLSYMTQRELDHFLANNSLPAHTKYTITDPAALKEDLQLSRRRGYSIEHMENEDNIISVAAPILDSKGEIIAVLATMTMAQLTSEQEIQRIGERLKETADNASRSLSA